jgi:hypothetical protein
VAPAHPCDAQGRYAPRRHLRPGGFERVSNNNKHNGSGLMGAAYLSPALRVYP